MLQQIEENQESRNNFEKLIRMFFFRYDFIN